MKEEEEEGREMDATTAAEKGKLEVSPVALTGRHTQALEVNDE